MTAPKGILIIDDDPSFSDELGNALREAGFHITVAPTGIAGLHALRAGYLPNLIILDVLMPDLDGIKFFEEVKSSRLTANIPVLVCGGSESAHTFAWVVKEDKPLELERLVATAKKYAR